MTPPSEAPLRARCAVCARRAECAARGDVLPEYPTCARPLLGTRVEAVRALFEWFGAGVDALAETGAAVAARFIADRERWSEVFEPSLSVDAAGEHVARFSYSFPGFRAEPAAAAEALARMAAPWGDQTRAACDRLVRAAQTPTVEHPLFGLDVGPPFRAKLYLQFRDDAGARAVALARAVVGGTFSAPGDLHMLGVDVGTAGVQAAKLYARVPAPPGAPALDHLPPLRRALVVYRLASPDDAPVPVDLDFSLIDNDLTERDLRQAPLGRQRAFALLDQVRAIEPVALRRVSVALAGPDRKTTLYYTPTRV